MSKDKPQQPSRPVAPPARQERSSPVIPHPSRPQPQNPKK